MWNMKRIRQNQVGVLSISSMFSLCVTVTGSKNNRWSAITVQMGMYLLCSKQYT